MAAGQAREAAATSSRQPARRGADRTCHTRRPEDRPDSGDRAQDRGLAAQCGGSGDGGLDAGIEAAQTQLERIEAPPGVASEFGIGAMPGLVGEAGLDVDQLAAIGDEFGEVRGLGVGLVEPARDRGGIPTIIENDRWL